MKSEIDKLFKRMTILAKMRETREAWLAGHITSIKFHTRLAELAEQAQRAGHLFSFA